MADEEKKPTDTAGQAVSKKTATKKKAVTKKKAATKKKATTKKAATKKKATTKKAATKKTAAARKPITATPSPSQAAEAPKADAGQQSKQEKVSEKLKDMGVMREGGAQSGTAVKSSSSNINFEFILIAMVIIFMVVFLAVFGDASQMQDLADKKADTVAVDSGDSAQPADVEADTAASSADGQASASAEAAAAVELPPATAFPPAESGDITVDSGPQGTAGDITQPPASAEPVFAGDATESSASADAAAAGKADSSATASMGVGASGSASSQADTTTTARSEADRRYPPRRPYYHPPVSQEGSQYPSRDYRYGPPPPPYPAPRYNQRSPWEWSN